jgi:hypothetical protein
VYNEEYWKVVQHCKKEESRTSFKFASKKWKETTIYRLDFSEKSTYGRKILKVARK